MTDFSNYAGLKAAIADILMRDDLTDSIPGFVDLAEASIRRDVRARGQIARVYINAGGANEIYENLPADYLEMAGTLRVNESGAYYPLTFLPPRDLEALWAANPGMTGRPEYYTIVGDQIQFFPQPTGQQVEMQYFQAFPALAADADTNFILTQAPDLYFYGALVHTAPFIREDPRIGVWNTLYQNAVVGFNKLSQRGRYSGAPLTMRPRRSIG